jgi:hypothetical protein
MIQDDNLFGEMRYFFDNVPDYEIAEDAFPNAILWPLLPASLAVTSYGVYFGYYGMVLGMGVLALVVVALTRGRLGYEHYQQEEEPESAMSPT